MKKVIILILAVLVPLACLTAPPHDETKTEELMERFITGLREENIDVLTSTYWPEAEMVVALPDGQELHFEDIEQIRSFQSEGFQDPNRQVLEFGKPEGEIRGSSATYRILMQAYGARVMNRFELARRNGQWRILHQLVEVLPPEQVRIGIVVSYTYDEYMASVGADRLARDFQGTSIHGNVTAEFGDRFTIEVVVMEKEETAKFRKLAERFSLIVCIHDFFKNSIFNTYRDFPNTHFLTLDTWIQGIGENENFTSYSVNGPHGMFVAGMAAAAFGTEKIAYLGSVNEEWMRRFAASFLAGAMYVDPKYQLPENYAYDFVGSWSDEEAAYAKAIEMYEEGSDLIFAHAYGSNPGIYRAAMEQQKKIIGYIEPDLWRFDLEQGRIVKGEQLGELLATVLELRMDQVLYYTVKKFLEEGPPRGGQIDAGGFDIGAWSLMKTDYNRMLVEEILAEAEIATQADLKGNLDICCEYDPEDMGLYIDRLDRYRQEHPTRRFSAAADKTEPKSAGPLPVISVMDLNLEKISKSEGFLIVDLLSSALIETKDFRVIDRAQRTTILEEIAFSMADCTDEACQLKAGRLLAADMIIIGSAGVIGSKYVLNLKVVDVETSVALQTAYKIFDNIDDLVVGIPPLVRKLSVK